MVKLMHNAMNVRLLIGALCGLVLVGCGAAPTVAPTTTPDAGATATAQAQQAQIVQTQVAIQVAAALTANAPTSTPTVTKTPTPVPTDTPTVTPTASDTPTPAPTDTPLPATSTPTRRPPAATPTPVPVTPPLGMDTKTTLQGKWELTLVSIHRDKTVYFYSDSKVAFGVWASFLFRAKNLQSGTDRFTNQYYWGILADGQLVKYDALESPDDYAAYMYCGCSSAFETFNPGIEGVFVVTADVPESTKQLQFVVLSRSGGQFQRTGITFQVDGFDKVPAFKPTH
jgi:hypothetical protein